jgi:hypothetical protein
MGSQDTLCYLECVAEWGWMWSYMATVLAAMVLGNACIKDMGGRMNNAL